MRDNVKGGALTETTFYILLAVYQPNHGYGIMQFVEQQTGGRLVLGAGTLYGALTTLQKKGLIAPYGTENSRKKEYLITEAGKRAAKTELARIEALYHFAARIVGENR